MRRTRMLLLLALMLPPSDPMRAEAVGVLSTRLAEAVPVTASERRMRGVA
jgi:hypothetical protein